MRSLCLAVAVALAPAPGAATGPGGPAERTRAAAEALKRAIDGLQHAATGSEQAEAIAGTIRAYEDGLVALREALRLVALREAALTLRLEARRETVARLLGVLSGISTDPGPLLLMHPDGPLGTARSGMLLAEVTPALQAEVDVLRADLAELATLRAAQGAALDTLAAGLAAAQKARTDLARAIARRGPLPRRLTEEPERLAELAAAAETLDMLAFALAPDLGLDDALPNFETARGRLELPVAGTVLRRAGEADAAGVVRPGWVIATRADALVTAPWAGTIRFRGPLLDYGIVMILEPGAGYLLVLAGLGTVFGEVGDVVPRGAPLGLMGGPEPATAEFLDELRRGTGTSGTETLYMELRQGAEPVDPGEWFATRQE